MPPISNESEDVKTLNTNQKLMLAAIILTFIVIFIYVRWGAAKFTFKRIRFKRRK